MLEVGIGDWSMSISVTSAISCGQNLIGGKLTTTKQLRVPWKVRETRGPPNIQKNKAEGQGKHILKPNFAKLMRAPSSLATDDLRIPTPARYNYVCGVLLMCGQGLAHAHERP